MWSELCNISNRIIGPWAIIGDFNIIADSEEKSGGSHYRINKSFDFLQCLSECRMQDAASACSDHVPLLAQFKSTSGQFVRYFKFLNFWTDHEGFMEVINNIWDDACFAHGPEKYLEISMKSIKDYELIRLEGLMISDNDGAGRSNLNKTRADYIKRLSINKIQDENYQWVEGTKEVSEATIRYFQGIFCEDPEVNNYSDLHDIDPMITEEVNNDFIALPNEEEIKNCVFSMDPDSAPGPDGFTAKFFQVAWTKVAPTVTMALKSIFCGANLPKWKSLELLMEALATYEKVSGQLVNKQESCVVLAPIHL
ncbi:uncharacterized protein [Nicotiana sylvestris]|uniref:uncharacterized protein n=1 Tax=Nicotiana sylvestris TaxID=4096 RepID=UPI00388CB4AA